MPSDKDFCTFSNETHYCAKQGGHTGEHQLYAKLYAGPGEPTSHVIAPTAAPALPLQRTLPDEQFKGAVVEAISSERDAVRREACIHCAAGDAPIGHLYHLFDESRLNCGNCVCSYCAASPAGRAEKAQK